jgi:hypothetical protein
MIMTITPPPIPTIISNVPVSNGVVVVEGVVGWRVDVVVVDSDAVVRVVVTVVVVEEVVNGSGMT